MGIMKTESELMSEMCFYILALQDGCFYVGISSNPSIRMKQHDLGKGAVWTSTHPPIGAVESRIREVKDMRDAEQIEDLITIEMMVKHGWRKVRGGHFCRIEESALEGDLRAYGVWDTVFQANTRAPLPQNKSVPWSTAIEGVLEQSKRYHIDNCPPEQREQLLESYMALRRYSQWNEDFAPALNCAFWDKKGILPVLLSIRDGYPIGSKLQDVFAVLCAALQRGRKGERPWNRLFLLTWQAFKPDALPHQQERVDQWIRELDPYACHDKNYDPFVTVAFPETRWLLREHI